MVVNFRHMDKIFKKRLRSTSMEQMEQRSADVLQRLRLEKEWNSKRNPAEQILERRHRRWQWPAAAAAVAAIVMAVILPTRILQGAPAVLEDAEGKRSIQYGELVRPVGDMSAMLSMRDGSRVETRSMSEFSLERMDDGGTRIRLKEGDLIVDASAKNRANLYVQTKDMTALVSGAVSLVKAEAEGSRIAAIGGEIRVQQGATEKKLTPGEQVASNPKMEPIPVKEELTWSRQAAEHVAMLEQAQSSLSGSPAPAARPKFAAASVRPIRFEEIQERRAKGERDFGGLVRCLGADGLLWATPAAQDPARRGRCFAKSTDIRPLVYAAYGSSQMPSWDRLVGWPRELFPEVAFQIEGVADDPEHVTKGELKLMLQTLLEDRFKARVHLETREVDGYTLTIAKSSIKFKETSGDVKRPTPGPGERGGGGPCQSNPNPIMPYIRGKCGMGDVAEFLQLLLAVNSAIPPIADNTGLMGIYNIDFAPEEIRVSPPIGTGVRGEGSQQARQFSPPIPKALEEQLGLHLERVKVPVEFVVIDHIEQPTEN
jgi:uncharacterized protein (TIGR03435 family)